MTRDTLIFENVNIDMEGLPGGRISFIASARLGHVAFELDVNEIKALVAYLNDFAGRSTPVCDEAE